MNLTIKRIYQEEIHLIVPFIQALSTSEISTETLQKRFDIMLKQPYECFAVYRGEQLIGTFGLWFLMKHYAGLACEPDHVYIDPSLRSQGIGKQIFDWIIAYATEKGCEASELNSYVSNFPSHKFYMNSGYHIIGYHFIQFFKD